ncbi:MAG: hypothetical protein EZS28_031174, partial [Streblomastix strix]
LKSVVQLQSFFLVNGTEKRIQYGTFGKGLNYIEPSGDSFIDNYDLPRLQNMNKDIDIILTNSTECLMTPDVLEDAEIECANPYKAGDYVTTPFYGLQQLMTEVQSSVQILINNQEPGKVNLADVDFFNILMTSQSDIRSGQKRIQDIIIKLIDKHFRSYTVYLNLCFALAIIFLVLTSWILVIPIPKIFKRLSQISAQIEDLTKMQHIKRIEWKEDMQTEVHRLDSGHKKLLETVMILFDTVKNFETSLVSDVDDEDQVILDKFDDLVLVTAAHFADEEYLMHRFNFPRSALNNHFKNHVSLFRKLMTYHQKTTQSKQNEIPPTSNEMLLFFTTWIIPHFTSIDIDLGLYLKQRNESINKQRGKQIQQKKDANQKDVDLADLLDCDPDLSTFKVPPSLNMFFNGPNASMQEKMIFDEAIDRIKMRQMHNQE